MGILTALVLFELVALCLSLTLLTGVRASIQREGEWSKTQRDGVIYLQNYLISDKAEWITKFEATRDIHHGIRSTFQLLKDRNPDQEKINVFLTQAGVDQEDLRPISMVYLHFSFVPQVKKSIDIYWQADALVKELEALKFEIVTTLQKAKNEAKKKDEFLLRLNTLNEEFAVLETSFSNSLGEGSRWLEKIIFRSLISLLLIVVLIGSFIGISVGNRIVNGLYEILKAAKLVAGGNFESRAKVLSQDEIGELAISFNEMIWAVEKMNAELGQFVFIVSHDLQEPLRTITNFYGLLRDPNKQWSEEEKQRFYGYIHDATERMQELIRDLMQFTRIGRDTQIEEVDLMQVTEQVLGEMEERLQSKGIIVKLEKLPVINGSVDDLRNMFYQLINNAIKFSKEGVVPIIHISHCVENNEHRLSFEDNGIGIANNQLHKIFEMFKRLHPKGTYPGTGVGLASCRKIAIVHRGRVEVESELGKGSLFIVVLPVNLRRSEFIKQEHSKPHLAPLRTISANSVV